MNELLTSIDMTKNRHMSKNANFFYPSVFNALVEGVTLRLFLRHLDPKIWNVRAPYQIAKNVTRYIQSSRYNITTDGHTDLQKSHINIALQYAVAITTVSK